MSCGVAIVVDGALRCSLSLFLNVLPFSNVFPRAVYMWAFEFVDYPTFFKFVVPVFGCHGESFYSVGPFEVYLYSLVVTCPLESFP